MRARASPTFSTSTSTSSSESSTSATSTDSSSTSASTTESASTSSASTSTALPSPTPTCPLGKPGVIQVSVNSTDPPIDGYISSILGPNGDYPFTTELTEALVVTLSSASTDGSDSCSALDAISSVSVVSPLCQRSSFSLLHSITFNLKEWECCLSVLRWGKRILLDRRKSRCRFGQLWVYSWRDREYVPLYFRALRHLAVFIDTLFEQPRHSVPLRIIQPRSLSHQASRRQKKAPSGLLTKPRAR